MDILIACEEGDINTIKKLIKKGSNIESRDEYGNTPLAISSYNEYIDVIKFLLEE